LESQIETDKKKSDHLKKNKVTLDGRVVELEGQLKSQRHLESLLEADKVGVRVRLRVRIRVRVSVRETFPCLS
jgi:hypothetical protein